MMLAAPLFLVIVTSWLSGCDGQIIFTEGSRHRKVCGAFLFGRDVETVSETILQFRPHWVPNAKYQTFAWKGAVVNGTSILLDKIQEKYTQPPGSGGKWRMKHLTPAEQQQYKNQRPKNEKFMRLELTQWHSPCTDAGDYQCRVDYTYRSNGIVRSRQEYAWWDMQFEVETSKKVKMRIHPDHTSMGSLYEANTLISVTCEASGASGNQFFWTRCCPHNDLTEFLPYNKEIMHKSLVVRDGLPNHCGENTYSQTLSFVMIAKLHRCVFTCKFGPSLKSTKTLDATILVILKKAGDEDDGSPQSPSLSLSQSTSQSPSQSPSPSVSQSPSNYFSDSRKSCDNAFQLVPIIGLVSVGLLVILIVTMGVSWYLLYRKK